MTQGPFKDLQQEAKHGLTHEHRGRKRFPPIVQLENLGEQGFGPGSAGKCRAGSTAARRSSMAWESSAERPSKPWPARQLEDEPVGDARPPRMAAGAVRLIGQGDQYVPTAHEIGVTVDLEVLAPPLSIMNLDASEMPVHRQVGPGLAVRTCAEGHGNLRKPSGRRSSRGCCGRSIYRARISMKGTHMFEIVSRYPLKRKSNSHETYANRWKLAPEAGVAMSRRSLIQRLIAGEPVPRCGFWLGNPHPETWPILHRHFGTGTEEELRRKLGDDVRWICPQFAMMGGIDGAALAHPRNARRDSRRPCGGSKGCWGRT